MNKFKLKLIKWLLHSEGFKFAALKEKNGNIWVEGDIQVIRHIDINKYFWKL